MQLIPTTGVTMGIQYKEKMGLSNPKKNEEPVTVCSLGDNSITEGYFRCIIKKTSNIIFDPR